MEEDKYYGVLEQVKSNWCSLQIHNCQANTYQIQELFIELYKLAVKSFPIDTQDSPLERQIEIQLRFEQISSKKFNRFIKNTEQIHFVKLLDKSIYLIETDNLYELAIIPILKVYIEQYLQSFLDKEQFLTNFYRLIENVQKFMKKEIQLLSRQSPQTKSFQLNYDSQEILDFCLIMVIMLSKNVVQFNSLMNQSWGKFFWKTLASIFSKISEEQFETPMEYVSNFIQQYNVPISQSFLNRQLLEVKQSNYLIIFESQLQNQPSKYKQLYTNSFMIIRQIVLNGNPIEEPIKNPIDFKYLIFLNENKFQNKILSHQEEAEISKILPLKNTIIQFDSMIDALAFSFAKHYTQETKLFSKFEKAMIKKKKELKSHAQNLGIDLSFDVENPKQMDQREKASSQNPQVLKEINFQQFKIIFSYLLKEDYKNILVFFEKNILDLKEYCIASAKAEKLFSVKQQYSLIPNSNSNQNVDLVVFSENIIYFTNTDQNLKKNPVYFYNLPTDFNQEKNKINNIAKKIEYSIDDQQIKQLSEVIKLIPKNSLKLCQEYQCFEFNDLGLVLYFVVFHLIQFNNLSILEQLKVIFLCEDSQIFISNFFNLQIEFVEQLIQKCLMDQDFLLTQDPIKEKKSFLAFYLLPLMIFQNFENFSLPNINSNLHKDNVYRILQFLEDVETTSVDTLHFSQIQSLKKQVLIWVHPGHKEKINNFTVIFKNKKCDPRSQINYGFCLNSKNYLRKFEEVFDKPFSSIEFETNPNQKTQSNSTNQFCRKCQLQQIEVVQDNIDYCINCFEDELFK